MANYLYNGVELPALPEWDKTVYPYACISYTITHSRFYRIFIGTGPIYRSDTDGSYDFGLLLQKSYALNSDSTAWAETSITVGEHWIANINNEWNGKFPVWTNADIIKSDGSVYLAASDPIPVNPAPTLDPTALLMCWQVGNRIRQRGGA